MFTPLVCRKLRVIRATPEQCIDKREGLGDGSVSRAGGSTAGSGVNSLCRCQNDEAEIVKDSCPGGSPASCSLKTCEVKTKDGEVVEKPCTPVNLESS